MGSSFYPKKPKISKFIKKKNSSSLSGHLWPPDLPNQLLACRKAVIFKFVIRENSRTCPDRRQVCPLFKSTNENLFPKLSPHPPISMFPPIPWMRWFGILGGTAGRTRRWLKTACNYFPNTSQPQEADGSLPAGKIGPGTST